MILQEEQEDDIYVSDLLTFQDCILERDFEADYFETVCLRYMYVYVCVLKRVGISVWVCACVCVCVSVCIRVCASDIYYL
jgi:hypothetical protein